MFNFLDSNLSPKVVCTSPALENYEVDNLISNTFALKLQGFMVYPAIKPPVEIEFEFICPVKIHHISLNTTVGSQKCNGIEIFAKSKDIDYTSIGRAIFNTPGIIFGNSRMYSRKDPPEKFNKNFEIRAFKGDTFKLFLNASSIKVVIFRTDKSVPCLGSVEVWGIPSKSCSQVTVDTIKRLAMRSEMRENTSKIPVNDIEELSIPDDFKDDLTCEIMLLPMTLPSGKSIDQTTLEKHIQSEESFGRKPGDPFTGIKFTDKIKPVLNVPLKSRIDMFILQNSHRQEFFSLKRTLGGNKNDHQGMKRKRYSSENIASDDPLEKSIDRAKRNSSYINFTSQTDSKTVVCLKCKIELNFLYKIPCDHFYCRKCLLDFGDIYRCDICEKPFNRNQIKKVNL